MSIKRLSNDWIEKIERILHPAIGGIPGATLELLEINPDIVQVGDMPPWSVRATVRGGDDVEIARVLYLDVPMGMTTHGSTRLVVEDQHTGCTREIRFERGEGRA